jgi:hypothetical protein
VAKLGFSTAGPLEKESERKEEKQNKASFGSDYNQIIGEENKNSTQTHLILLKAGSSCFNFLCVFFWLGRRREATKMQCVWLAYFTHSHFFVENLKKRETKQVYPSEACELIFFNPIPTETCSCPSVGDCIVVVEVIL